MLGLLVAIHWLKRDWVLARRATELEPKRWPIGWPVWAKWPWFGCVIYAVIHWMRGGAPIVAGRGVPTAAGGQTWTWQATAQARTALWIVLYGTVFLSSLYLLRAEDRSKARLAR